MASLFGAVLSLTLVALSHERDFKIMFGRSKGKPKLIPAVYVSEVATYNNNIEVLLNTYPYSVDDESRDTVGSDTSLEADLFDLAQTLDIGELELQPSPKVRQKAPRSLLIAKINITDPNVTAVPRPEDVASLSIEWITQPQRLKDIVKAPEITQDVMSTNNAADSNTTTTLPEQVVAPTSNTARTGHTPSAQAANALFAPRLRPPINRVVASGKDVNHAYEQRALSVDARVLTKVEEDFALANARHNNTARHRVAGRHAQDFKTVLEEETERAARRANNNEVLDREAWVRT
ncbi:hypothetical protein LTR95_002856 [Oleoguttula sp. CCFEE 5521]